VHGESGFVYMSEDTGVVGSFGNTGTIAALGKSRFQQVNVTNAGEIRLMALSGEASELTIDNDYAAGANARLVLDWSAGSEVDTLSPMLTIAGNASGTTEVGLGRIDGLDVIDWTVTPAIPVIEVLGETEAGASTFEMNEGRGLYSYRLQYADAGSETWSLTRDTTIGPNALTAIPYAARGLFKQATDAVGDRLDELRTAFATNGSDSGPLGYAPSPNDPVTAALALSAPDSPANGAWMKTTGRYAEGDGSQTLAGTIEAGIDTTFETGAGRMTVGAFAGTGASQIGFDLADTDATLSGPLVGAYTNYSSDRAFVGATGAVQSLAVDATLQGESTSFSGITYGGRVDAGYRFGDELIIEPAVALAASHTEFDTFEMNAIDVGFVDADSFAAEARLKIARDFAFDGTTVTPFVVATLGNEFLGSDGVDAGVLGIATGNNGGIYGDLGAGVTVVNESGTLSGFARGNLSYAAEEISGGVRLGANAAF